ncbi:MAG: acetoacetate decarboxylase family protein, partial [Acidimicrobiales bacterium]
DGNGLTDPHLVYGSYHRHYEVFERIEGHIELGESPFDPVADVAVEKLRSITWGRRRTVQTGKIIERVPEEWLLPYVHQRYDELALLLSTAGT